MVPERISSSSSFSASSSLCTCSRQSLQKTRSDSADTPNRARMKGGSAGLPQLEQSRGRIMWSVSRDTDTRPRDARGRVKDQQYHQQKQVLSDGTCWQGRCDRIIKPIDTREKAITGHGLALLASMS